MPYEVSDAVKAAFDGNTTGFQDAINSVLGDKLRERIGVQKVAVAQNFFNEPADLEAPDEFENNEEISDEDL